MNPKQPFYVDVGTSVVAIRCASNHDVIERYDHVRHPHTLELAKDTCGRMNREVEIHNSGDCAKLREALKLCVDEMCNRCRDLASARGNPLPCLQGCGPVREAKAALAAPPRNCDRFASAEEAWGAYDAWVESYWAQGKTEPFNEFGWLLAPATETEGGAK